MSKPSQKKPDPKKQKTEEEPEEIDDGPHIFTTISEQVKKNLIPQNKIEKANLIDYTICIIHPNLITKHKTCKEIIEKITSNNFNIFNFLQKQLSKQEIQNIYFKHTKATYFNDILTHMSTGPVAILVLTNKEEFFFDENNIKTYYKSPIERWKDMIGDKDPAIAKSEDEESLRAIYGTTIINNGFWGSDNASDAYRELSMFYLPLPCTPPVYNFDENLINIDTILKFLVPPKPDHTDLSGRLDMIGKYGPVCNHHVLDICICRKCRPNVKSILRKNGVLLKKNRDKVLTDEFIFKNKNVFCEECLNHFDNWSHIFGGIEGTHILTNEEIEFMMKDMNKNDLLEILIAEKGSSGKTILSKFDLNKPPNEIVYTKEHALKLISYLKTDYYDRYDFEELQNLINEDRRIRLNFWVSKMLHKPIESFPNPKLINFTGTEKEIKDIKNPHSKNFTILRNQPLKVQDKNELKVRNLVLQHPIILKDKLTEHEINVKVEKLLTRNIGQVTEPGEKIVGPDIKNNMLLLRNYDLEMIKSKQAKEDIKREKERLEMLKYQ